MSDDKATEIAAYGSLAAAAVLLAAGVLLLAGVGWALICAGVSFLAFGAVILRGLRG